MPTWYKAAFRTEDGEFDRITTALVPKKSNTEEYNDDWNMMFSRLKMLYEHARPVTLQKHIWNVLENTDSQTIKTLDDVFKAVHRNQSSSGPRDVSKVILEMQGRARCPIVVRYKTNNYVLVAGNTRLMVCKMLSITPSIILLDITK